MKEFLDWLKSNSDQINTLIAILGFSLVGVITTISKIFKTVTKKYYLYFDKKFFKTNSENVRALATKDGSFNLNESVSLKKVYFAKKELLKNKLKTKLSEDFENEINQLASGSTQIKYAEIIRNHQLLLNTELRNLNNDSKTTLSAFVSQFQSINSGNLTIEKNILIGHAGDGKSLACKLLRDTITHTTENWCLFISPKDFNTNSNLSVGEKEWATRSISNLIGNYSPTDFELLIIEELILENSILIIDALDEISQKLSKESFIAFINSWCFKKAIFVTTRESHYYNSLLGFPEIKDFNIVSLESVNQKDKSNYIKNICKRLYGNNSINYSNDINNLIKDTPSLSQAAQSPILLLMLCEIASKASLKSSLSMIMVYESWINEFTVKEIEKIYKEISFSEFLTVLEDIAWNIYLKVDNKLSLTYSLNEEELKKIILNRIHDFDGNNDSKFRKLIISSPLLILSTTNNLRETKQIHFRHESFLDFLIASRFNAWLLGYRNDGEDFFNIIESPGISYFIKEFLNALKESPEKLQIANKRLLDLLESLLEKRFNQNFERDARINSFATGQISYYLGMIANQISQKRLIELSKTTEDFWIKRCTAIGLMFGGIIEPYDTFIDEIRNEISEGSFSLGRKNIAIELGFYGDLDFNKFDPTFDSSGESCRRLMSRVTYELTSEIELPNWRLYLFNLIYLWKHYPTAKNDFEIAIKENIENLRMVLNTVELNHNKANYPEINEFRKMVEINS